MRAEKDPIAVWQLYGEDRVFPDLLHVERIRDRAAGLDWTIAPHRHLHLHQLFLLTSGEIHMTLDATAPEVRPPAVINIPRGVVHGFRFSAGTEGFVVTLPAGDHPELFAPAAETGSAAARSFVAAAPAGIAERFAAVSEDHAGSGPWRATRLRAGAGLILCAMLTAGGGPVAKDPRAKAGDPRVARFAAQVRDHLRARRSVADHARSLALSARHLSRLCREETGLSAQAYIEAQTTREACRLLVYTRMPVQAVAFHLGYDDPSYFSRAFQRNAGLSPSGYRARFER